MFPDFFPTWFFNGDIKGISILIAFSYFPIIFSGVLRSIYYINLHIFSKWVLKDYIIPLIFSTWFSRELDIMTYNSNVQRGCYEIFMSI
jgi:hypothetical protein